MILNYFLHLAGHYGGNMRGDKAIGGPAAIIQAVEDGRREILLELG